MRARRATRAKTMREAVARAAEAAEARALASFKAEAEVEAGAREEDRLRSAAGGTPPRAARVIYRGRGYAVAMSTSDI